MSAATGHLAGLSPKISVSRIVSVVLLGTLVTAALFVLMQAMVYQDAPNFEDEAQQRIADIYIAERVIKANIEEELPDKPEEPDIPPPRVLPPVADRAQVSANAINLNVQIVAPKIGIGAVIGGGEYLPIIKIAPIYPRRAQSRGVEGHCTVEYTVTSAGTTENPKVVDCSSPLFQKTSLNAALKFKYKPRVLNGEAIAVDGVQNRFIFELKEK